VQVSLIQHYQASGFDPIVGHLGVHGPNGVPQAHGGPAAAPGLCFIGYPPSPSQFGRVGREARRAARQIKHEIAAACSPERVRVRLASLTWLPGGMAAYAARISATAAA
jgi:hypothetical protein